MLKTVDSVVKVSVKLIKKKFPKSQIYLFGSRVRPPAGKYADIDIGLVGVGNKSAKSWIELQEELANLDTFTPVQLVDLDKTSEKFKKGVLAYAKKLK